MPMYNCRLLNGALYQYARHKPNSEVYWCTRHEPDTDRLAGFSIGARLAALTRGAHIHCGPHSLQQKVGLA